MKKAILILLILSSPAAAQRRRLPLPAAECTLQAELWLARSFIGEAGWEAARDHAGIAWVLARRWRRQIRRWPDMTFVTVVKNYVHALGFRRRSGPTRRQRWLRGLLGPLAPEGWPARSSWRKHVGLWRSARARSRDWMVGRVPDPCRGRAWNWGGHVDEGLAQRKALNEVDCGETANTFYDDGGDSDGK